MSGGIEIQREGEICYAKPLHRALLRDSRLSFGARGLFSFLWDLPAGWRTNSTHLALMSPKGRDAIRTLLKELEKVGAMRSEPIRNAIGRMAGKRWILVTPENWAVASPLAARKVTSESTEGRNSRPSDNPKVGNSDNKDIPGEGFAFKSTTNQPDIEINDLVDAAVWAYKKSGNIIKSEGGLRRAIRKRICSCPTGPNQEDIKTLVDWRNSKKIESEREVEKQILEAEMKAKEMKSLEITEDIERVLKYFESLSESKQKELLSEFEEHVFTSNTVVFTAFKKNGIKSKVVLVEFLMFIKNKQSC